MQQNEFLEKTRSNHLYCYLRDKFIPKAKNLGNRKCVWLGEKGYKYGRVEHSPAPMSDPIISRLKSDVEQYLGTSFNGVLLNFYANGKDCIPPHRDDEPSLGDQPVIASTTLGASRRFVFSPLGVYSGHGNQVYHLHHGSLFVMAGTTNRYWLHSLPRDSDCNSPRINFTFRLLY